MVILSDDILTIPASQIKDVRVLTTIVGGKSRSPAEAVMPATR